MQRNIVILFLLLSLNLSAEEIEIPIETLIEKIHSSKGDNRRNLMNELKLRLRRMNSKNREKTILELKTSIKKQGGEGNGAKYQGREKQHHGRQPIYRQNMYFHYHMRGHR